MVGQKTSKSAKIFPLEKFRLYGILRIKQIFDNLANTYSNTILFYVIFVSK